MVDGDGRDRVGVVGKAILVGREGRKERSTRSMSKKVKRRGLEIRVIMHLQLEQFKRILICQ